MQKLKLSVAVVLLILSPSSFSETFMSEQEMLEFMPGKTFSGLSEKDGKTPWVQTVGLPKKKGKTKGKIVGDWNNGESEYKSKWYIKKGAWCENWGSGRGCWKLERLSDNSIRAHRTKSDVTNIWTIE